MTLTEAERRGVQSQFAGRPAPPVCDQQFIRDAVSSSTSTADLLAAYTHGWTIANLAEAANSIRAFTAPSIAELKRILSSRKAKPR